MNIAMVMSHDTNGHLHLNQGVLSFKEKYGEKKTSAKFWKSTR